MGKVVCYRHRSGWRCLLCRRNGSGIPPSLVLVLSGLDGDWFCLGGLDFQETKHKTMASLGCLLAITLVVVGAAYFIASIVFLAVLWPGHLHRNNTLAAEGLLLCSIF